MTIKIKKIDKNTVPKKILIYGLPGHGKSTFAQKFCKKHGLKPIILDFDETNFTGDDVTEVDMRTDLIEYNSVLSIVKDVKNYDYDTVIFDGLGSFLEDIVSNSKGQSKYGDRNERFKTIFKELRNSKKNLIFIGQEDCNIEHYVENQPNRPIIKVNSIVNEIYQCIKKDNKHFLQVQHKFRKELENLTDEEPHNESKSEENTVTGKENKEHETEGVLFRGEDFEGIEDDKLASEIITRTKDHLNGHGSESNTTAVRKIIKARKDELNNLRESKPNLFEECWKLTAGGK